MRRKSVSQKQYKSVVFAFVVTLLISMGAFYFIYQQNVTYGKSVQGLQKYACAQYMRETGASSCPSFTVIQATYELCCCETKGGFGLDVRAQVGVDATEASRAQACTQACGEYGAKQFIDFGRCGFKLPQPG